MLVFVEDNDVAKAPRVLKKKLSQQGFFGEWKRRRHFETAVEKRHRKLVAAKRRERKDRLRRAITTGELPAPKPGPKARPRAQRLA
jgi:ribosomal protein S21